MNTTSNSEDFITKLVNDYSDTMYRVAYNITKNREDALDVCQEVFIRLIKSIGKIKDEAHLKAWLLRATVNCAKSNCVQAHKRHCISSESGEEISVCSDLESTELFDAVIRLPEKYRIVIHLFYYEDLTLAEISDVLKITKASVKSRLFRAREMLRNTLEREN